MQYKNRLGIVIACLLALTTPSCQATQEAMEKGQVMKTAVAFYKTLEDPNPETEKVMELKDYRIYRFPALVYGSLGITSDVEKLQGSDEAYGVAMTIWCHGTTATGEQKKLRRQLLVRVTADPTAERGWSVSRFKFQGDEELTFVRQFFTWLLWMFLAPLAFLFVVAIFFRRSMVAFMVAYMMGIPIQIYVSYLCFGTVWGTVAAMLGWTITMSLLRGRGQEAQA